MTQDQNNNTAVKSNKGAFLKAMIKINHPDWTAEHIEAEFKIKMEKLNNPDNSDEDYCESCSG